MEDQPRNPILELVEGLVRLKLTQLLALVEGLVRLKLELEWDRVQTRSLLVRIRMHQQLRGLKRKFLGTSAVQIVSSALAALGRTQPSARKTQTAGWISMWANPSGYCEQIRRAPYGWF